MGCDRLLWCVVAVVCVGFGVAADADARNVATGSLIYEHGYCDQPYVLVLDDGAWLCVFTTSGGQEGSKSQYVVATRSVDLGKTWSAPVPIELPDGPEASWAMPLLTRFGRVYTFYSYNGDRVHTLPDGKSARADMLGWYCAKYSDDGGATWSERIRLALSAPLPLETARVALPSLDEGGFTLEFEVTFETLDTGQVLLDARNENGHGFACMTTDRGTIKFNLSDGNAETAWDCDPGLLQAGRRHHVAVIVDGGPNILMYIVDGTLCDGGEHRQYGWGRIPASMGTLESCAAWRISSTFDGRMESLRVYDRALRTTEAIGNFLALSGAE